MAIRTSTPRSSFLTWSSIDTPPISSATVQLVIDAVFLEALRDLGGELARRLQNEGARHAGAGAARLQQRQHRQDEGSGLAGSRLGDAEHVAARHGDGNGCGLDRGRRSIACSLDSRLHFFAELKVCKSHIQLNFRTTSFGFGE